MSFSTQQSLPQAKQAAAFVAPQGAIPPAKTAKTATRRTALGGLLHRTHDFLVDQIGLPVLTNRTLPSGRFNSLNDKQTDQFLKAFSTALRDATEHKGVSGFREKMERSRQAAPASAAAKLAEAQYRAAFDLIVRQRLRAALQPPGSDQETGRKFVAETKEALAIYHASQDARRPAPHPPTQSAQPAVQQAPHTETARPSLLQGFMAAGKAMLRRNVDRVLHKTADALVNLGTKVEALRPALAAAPAAHTTTLAR